MDFAPFLGTSELWEGFFLKSVFLGLKIIKKYWKTSQNQLKIVRNRYHMNFEPFRSISGRLEIFKEKSSFLCLKIALEY